MQQESAAGEALLCLFNTETQRNTSLRQIMKLEIYLVSEEYKTSLCGALREVNGSCLPLHLLIIQANASTLKESPLVMKCLWVLQY